MASHRPTTPVPDDCPVCLETLRLGYARVDWCSHHPLCRECAERIQSGGDCRCPLCRQPWRMDVSSRSHHELCPHGETIEFCDFCSTPRQHLTACSHGNRGFCVFCVANEHSHPIEDDMNWTPEGDDGVSETSDEDPYIRQWNEENGEDVPLYVRAYDVSF